MLEETNDALRPQTCHLSGPATCPLELLKERCGWDMLAFGNQGLLKAHHHLWGLAKTPHGSAGASKGSIGE